MKLVCSQEKQEPHGAAFMDLGPLRILGPREALFKHLNNYKWPMGLSDPPKLLQTLQSIQETAYGTSFSPCRSCQQKVICLVESHTDQYYKWPGETCPILNNSGKAIPDKKLHGIKIKTHKLKFVMDHKCELCAFKACCYQYLMIVRMLCPNFTKKEVLIEKAVSSIQATWTSVDRFMAGLSAGWTELYWRPPEGKRKRRYRVALVYPNHRVELIQDYYPYTYVKSPVPAYKLGLVIPEKKSTVYSRDHILTAWILWNMMRKTLIHTRKWRRPRPEYIRICGHNNLLLSLFVNHSGHPVLVTSTSRWKYNTVFSDFNDIGWNLEWSAMSVLDHLDE